VHERASAIKRVRFNPGVEGYETFERAGARWHAAVARAPGKRRHVPSVRKRADELSALCIFCLITILHAGLA
jgi:hypothetical protein